MTGAELIAVERRRQIDAEGYDAAHDDEHRAGELAVAASHYARNFGAPWPDGGTPYPWPFEAAAWKPTTAVGDLVKAGALIAAEIDRRYRVEAERYHAITDRLADEEVRVRCRPSSTTNGGEDGG